MIFLLPCLISGHIHHFTGSLIPGGSCCSISSSGFIFSSARSPLPEHSHLNLTSYR